MISIPLPLKGSAKCGAILLCSLTYAAVAAPVQAPEFDVRSTSAALCGTGTPPPGHLPPEVRPGVEGITLTVRQDGNRLCYVADGNTEAPVIRVRLGSELTVRLENEITDPGAIDAISGPGKLTTPNERVPNADGFYPVLPGMRHPATGATNLHMHGFAVPPVKPQDDVLTVCTDPASGPAGCGQRSFTYHYRVPANMPEGLYWYHPHVHGEVQAQMLMGLTGAIIVEGPRDDARRAAGIEERVLIVRQTQDLDAGKTQAAAMTAAPLATSETSLRPGPRPPATALDTADELLCNRNSAIDAISLNGTPVPLGDAPESALANIKIAANGEQFWRILNAATDAFLDISIDDTNGRALPFEVVARDGSPLTDDAGAALRPAETLQSQSVPPSGRIEILVRAPPAGTKAYLVTHAVDTGCAGDRVPERRLAVIEASPTAASISVSTPPAVQKSTRPDLFSGLLARHTDRERVVAFAEYPRPGSEDQIDFYIIERKPGAVLKPYEMGDPPAITVNAGTTEEWIVENWTNELHAFHIHQVHFRLLEIDGQRVDHPPLLDVVTVPYATATGYHSKEGPVRPGRVRIKLYFPESLAGDIPFHCHLVDHEDNGMMAVLRVIPDAHPQNSALR
jgi:FtsP/CotA-like multicopper oxidase with cupredoxin domain